MSKAWSVTIAAFLGGVALSIAQNKVLPVIGAMMQEFDMSMAAAGWLSSVFAVTGMLVAIPSAVIMGKVGPKKLGIAALVISGIGAVIGALSPGMTMLFVSRVIEGIGAGIIAVAAPGLIAMWFPAASRGLPMGVWGSYQMIAQSSVFLIGNAVAVRFGWQGLWWFGIAFLVSVLVLFIMKVSVPKDGENHAAHEGGEELSLSASLAALKVPSVWFMSVGALCFTFCCFGFVTWIAPYWVATWGISVDKANSYVSIIYVLEIPMVIALGWLLDRIKNRKLFGQLSFVLYAIVMYFCFRMGTPTYIWLFVFVYPLLEGAIPVALWTLIPQAVPNPGHSGMAIGVLSTMLNLGMVLGPPVVGGIIESRGWAAGTLPLVAGTLIGAVSMTFAKVYSHEAPVVRVALAAVPEGA